MTRLKPLTPDNTSGKTKELLEAVKSKLGRVPNMAGAMAHSPALLEGYLSLSGALGGGKLSPELREFISLAVAERNGCAYCLSAHTTIGSKMLGIDELTLLKSRNGESIDDRTDAALSFVRSTVDKKGKVSEEEFTAVKAAGFSDEEIAEISGNIALNLLTNYFNELAGNEIDFPIKVQPLEKTATK